MNIKEIENIYAQNSKTPAFLVLVNHYYNNKLYSHAQKICEEGLKIHPHNLDAHYINAKLILLYGEVKKAEKSKRFIKILQRDSLEQRPVGLKIMKKLLLASAMSLLVSTTAFAEDIKLGIIFGFTGPIESLTPDMAKGAEAASEAAKPKEEEKAADAPK